MTHVRLRKDEKAFLAQHGIPEDRVADMRVRADWASCAEFMHPIGCYVAWGFRRCDQGHRLTTAKGKCIQCDTRPIGFMKGYWTPGHVYLLVSESHRIVKVGWSSSLQKRVGELRSERIAFAEDWLLVRSHFCTQPALLEKALHNQLAKHRAPTDYMRHLIPRKAGEIFSCSRITAVRAWSRVLLSRAEW